MAEARMGPWIRIETQALKHNIQQVQAKVGSQVKVLAVVKANAYGLGLIPCARIFADHGAAMLGVSTVEEGLTLRQGGLSLPILVFAPALPSQWSQAYEKDLTLSVTSREGLQALREAFQENRPRPLKVHLKVDTGMGRFGVWPEDAVEAAGEIQNSQGLFLEGVYTHFATAGAGDGPPFQKQWQRFQNLLDALNQAQIEVPLRHCANSSALLHSPQTHLDMVRTGTLLYGQGSSELDLRNPWQAQTVILEIRTLPPGHPVGYGQHFRTRRPTRVAVVAAGFADGLDVAPLSFPQGLQGVVLAGLKSFRRWRHPRGGAGWMEILGEKAPILGKVGMQLTMVDVTHLPKAKVGDPVVFQLRRTSAAEHLPRCFTDSFGNACPDQPL